VESRLQQTVTVARLPREGKNAIRPGLGKEEGLPFEQEWISQSEAATLTPRVSVWGVVTIGEEEAVEAT
jgi:hypothetical protein